jgi:hypothetical protein
MKVDRAKLVVAIAGLAFAAIGIVIALLAAGVVQRGASEGADPASALVEVPDGVPALEGVVTWRDDAPLQQRVVEPATRRAVEAAWTRAWHALQLAAEGDDSLLDTWFSGSALAQATTMYGTPATATSPVTLRLGEHHLQVTFYSHDGAVMGLHADPVLLHRIVMSADGPQTLTTEETYDVVLVLEDGNWRIRQWLRTAAVVLDDEAITAAPDE